MRLVVVMLLVGGLAGCLNTENPEFDEGEGAQDYTDPDRNITVDGNLLPATPPEPGTRNSTAAAEWRLGEWWTFRLTSFLDTTVVDSTRIVAGTELGNYLVGFPIDEFSNEVMIFHFPGYGDIQRDDLSYDMHDVPFKPLDFPLTPGKEWYTNFEDPNVFHQYVVQEERDGKVFMEIQDGSGAPIGSAEYHIEWGEISKLVVNGYGMYEVLDHGYNFTGAVRVPHAHDLVFMNGRLGPSPIGNSEPAVAIPGVPFGVALPDEQVFVEGLYDRVSFAIILVDVPQFLLGTGGAATGVYQQNIQAPDGTRYSDTLTPGDGVPIKISFHENEDPIGTWDVQSIAAGAGQVLFEGIGYHSIDIELPSGCVRPSENANHHGLLCQV